MSIDTVLKEAIRNLDSGDLELEEQVKTAVITPILDALDWSARDPGSLRPEYRAGSGRVGYALLCHDHPYVFVEAKKRGSLDAEAEAQLFRYAANQGVPLLVLTDGYWWDFYLSMEAGPPEERQFCRLELCDSASIPQYVTTLESYLRKAAVESDEALRRAQECLARERRRRRAWGALPSVWNALLDDPNSALRGLLAEVVLVKSGIEPQESDVEEFLRRIPRASPSPMPGDRPPPPKPEKSPTAAPSRERLQDVVRDLMRIVLEEFPATLDDDQIDHLQSTKNSLGLKLGNYTLIRDIRDGRKIRGHGRYWSHEFGGQWFVCSEWWKHYNHHNAQKLTEWIEVLLKGVQDTDAKKRLRGILSRLSNYSGPPKHPRRS